MRVRVVVVGAVLLAGCEIAEAPAPASGNNVCDPPPATAELPSELRETSGVAASRAHAGIYWTHNDSGGEAVVFGVDSAGAVRARIRLREASNRDWEDIAVGPCEPEGGSCLWVAEIGDNRERHPHVAAYRLPEPALDDTVATPEIFRFTYPDGPRDAEALFVTDAGIHVINKGRTDAIELFRLAPPYAPDSVRSLTRLQRIAPPPTSVSAQVTAAAVHGDRVIVRSYSSLRFYEIDGDTLLPVGRAADGPAPEQLQGEGVDYARDGRLVLTGESQGARPATILLLYCDPHRAPADTTD